MSEKLISIRIPVYNEIGNISILVEKITNLFTSSLNKYNYEIIFSDNKSTDGTREWILARAKNDKHIKAIFNTRNMRGGSGLNLLRVSSGDCCIVMAGDLQDPPELIEKLINGWEQGYKIVIATKATSKENTLMFNIRKLYYNFIDTISDFEQIKQFSSFGLYDKDWMDFYRKINDPELTNRNLISKYGYDYKEIKFNQPLRFTGKSKNNFFSLYSIAMKTITASSDRPLRFITFLGLLTGIISLISCVTYFILKLVHWKTFQAGTAPIIILLTMIGGLVLFSIGILGEYIISINRRIMNYPHVLEEKRINLND